MYPVSISARLIYWPQKCCCCSGRTNATLNVTAENDSQTHSKTWGVPYCSDCIAHLDAAQRYQGGISILIVLLLGGGSFMLAAKAGAPFLVTVLLMILVPWAALWPIRKSAVNEATRRMQKHCTCSHAAVSYFGWSGTVHRFGFSNREYRDDFIKGNVGKILR